MSEFETAVHALASEYWNQRLSTSPIMATALGERGFDHLLGDSSPKGLEKEARELDALLEKARALRGQSKEASVTLGELIDALERDRESLEGDAHTWMVSHFTGPQATLLRLNDMHVLRDPEATQGYLDRLAGFGGQIDVLCDHLETGIQAGKFAPRMPAERTLGQLENLLEADPAEWALVQHLDSLPKDFPLSASEAKAQAVASLKESFLPALERYRDLIREKILPHARDDEHPGMMHVAGGLEAYRTLVRAHTSLELDPAEIHEIGKREVERILEEFRILGEKIFGISDLPQLQAKLREDRSLYYQSEEEIEAKARAAVERATQALDGVFGLRPEAPCQVQPIPAHEAPDATLAYYQPPAADGSRPGIYYINTYDPTTRPTYEAEVLAFHEAVPGHHLQISIAQGLSDLPKFRRHGGVTAYIEGWALYTEKLSEEMQLYSSDLDRLGARSFDAWRACRLVVDTGLHALGWSRQQAIDYMAAHTLLTRENIANEVDRYLVMPGQALSYKLGELEIFRLRRKAEETLGAGFDLAGFHDKVLQEGALSLKVLAHEVEAWVEGCQAQAG